MNKYNLKVSLEFENESTIYYGLNETTDEEVIIDLIEKLLLKEYKNMDQIKIAEEVLLNSNLEFKVKELYKSIKEELDDYFKGTRTIHEYLIET